MSHHQLQLALLILAGCGGSEGGLAIEMSTRAVLAQPLNTVRVDLHTTDRACDDIRTTGPRVLGSYTMQIDLGPTGAKMGSGQINGIVPSDYNLAVWGFVAAKPVAFACGQITIQDGVRTTVPV